MTNPAEMLTCYRCGNEFPKEIDGDISHWELFEEIATGERFDPPRFIERACATKWEYNMFLEVSRAGYETVNDMPGEDLLLVAGQVNLDLGLDPLHVQPVMNDDGTRRTVEFADPNEVGFCDLCDLPYVLGSEVDHNPETGNHWSCEEREAAG